MTAADTTVSAARDNSTQPARSRLEIAAVIGAAVLGLIVLWAFRFRGWYPHDEGVLGQSAERVLLGQVPHRDFDDPYSGGLGLLHALVFRLNGISMNALRNHLALIATAWFGGIFWLLTRWLRPFGAAVVAVLVAVLSVPLYPAAIPSWYVLFLTCAAGAVLVAWPWRLYVVVFVAGGLIGVAALAKITAAFALAGAMWALVALRQAEDRKRHGAVEVLIAGLIFAGMVVRLAGPSLNGRVLAHIVLPPLAVVFGLVWREVNQGRAHGFGIDVELWRRIVALLAGAAVPVLAYGAWLSHNGALAPFIASLRSVVGSRTASASLPPPSVLSILYALPIAAILLAGDRRLTIRPQFLAGAGLVLGLLAWYYHGAYGAIWNGLRGMLPLGAVLFCITWPAAGPEPASPARRALMVFVPITGMMVLTQFPFAAPIYFIYVLPLLVLAVAAAVSLRPAKTQVSAGVLAMLYVLFGLFEVIPGAPDSVGVGATHFPPQEWLQTARGRLLVSPEDVASYRELVATLDSLPPGPIWAGPDAPEVAFLSGRADLNRNFFAFIADDGQVGDDAWRRLLALGAQAVVVDTEPRFSRPLTADARAGIGRYFPQMNAVERFQIYRRDTGK